MKKSCRHCGRIHDKGYVCDKKPVRTKKVSTKDKFRWTTAWQSKRVEIRERDLNLCQVCIRKLYDTHNQYTYDNLGVHHIDSLEDCFDKRLDNDNLITLCNWHHEMAENGDIPKEELIKIVEEQEKSTPGL